MFDIQNFILGKESAFKEFYDLTHHAIYRFTLQHTRNKQAAEDLLQTAYLGLWKNRHRIEPSFPAFKSYLYTTVRNLIIKEYHHQLANQKAVLIYQSKYNEEHTVIKDFDNHSTLVPHIKNILKAFPKRQQQVFELIKFKGYTYQETAQILSISESTVEKHMIKALRHLRLELLKLPNSTFE